MLATPEELLARLKEKLKQRGAKGVLGLQRIFKIIDDDGSKAISFSEFKKALRDFDVGQLQEEEAIMLFNMFDRNRDGTINYDEFLRLLRVN